MNKINAAFKPYRDALKRISDEVKRFGGDGNIHGSIVDIDFFNHIYLSPYNGNILPYFAYDVTCPVDYKSVQELLKNLLIHRLMLMEHRFCIITRNCFPMVKSSSFRHLRIEMSWLLSQKVCLSRLISILHLV